MKLRVLTSLAAAAAVVVLWPVLAAAAPAEITIAPQGGGELVSVELGDTLALEVAVDAVGEEITGLAIFLSYEAAVFRLIPSGQSQDGAAAAFEPGEFLEGVVLLNRAEERGDEILLSYVVASGVRRRAATGQGVAARFLLEVTRRPASNRAAIAIEERGSGRASHYVTVGSPGTERQFGHPLGSLDLQVTGFKVRALPDVVVLESELDTLFGGKSLDDFVVQEGAAVIWSVSPVRELGTIIGPDHRVTMHPEEGFVGDVPVTFTALELGERNEDSADITVHVRSRPRILHLPELLTLDEDETSQPLFLDSLVLDRDDAVGTLSWTASAGQFVRANIDSVRRQVTFAAERDSFGTETIHLTATDPGGLAATDSIRVTVRAVNDPPQVLQRPPVYPVLGEGPIAIPLGELLEDVDDDLGSLQILHPSEAAASAELSSDRDSLLVTGVAVGRAVIQLVVEDREGDGDIGRLVAVVLPGGASVGPEILPLPTLCFRNGQDGVLPLASLVRDDGPMENLIWGTAPDSGLHLAHVVDGSLVVTAKSGFSGSSRVLLSVTDADQNEDVSELTVVVLEAGAGASPVIHAPGNFGIVSSEDRPVTRAGLDPLVEDPDSKDSQITWEAKGSDDITASVDADTRMLMLSATPGVSGLRSVLLVATDPTARTDTASVPVLVVRPGEGPALTHIPPVSLDSVGASGRVDLDEFVFDDLDLDSELYWTAKEAPGIDVELDPVSHLLRLRRQDAGLRPAPLQSRVVLKVVDTNGNEAFGTLEVSLPPAFKLNRIPDIEFFTGAVDTTLRLDEYVAESGPKYPLRWSVAEPQHLVADVDTVTTRVRLAARNPGYIGTEVITFTAADTTGRLRSASVRILVKGRGLVPQVRQFPVLQILAGGEDTSLDLDEFVVDDDPDSVLIWIHNAPDSLDVALDPSTRRLTVSVREGAVGSREITFLVRDPAGNSSLAVLDVIVMRGGEPPTIAPLPQLLMPAGAPEQAMGLDPYVSDPDTPVEQIIWEVTAETGVAARVDERRLFLRVPAGHTGMRYLVLTATDPEGNQSEAKLTVLIQVDDQPPLFGVTVKRDPVSDDVLRMAISPSEPLIGEPQVRLAGESQPVMAAADGSYEVTYRVPDVQGNQLLTTNIRGTDGAGNEGVRDLAISLLWISEEGGSLHSGDGSVSLNIPDEVTGQGRLVSVWVLADHETPPGSDGQPAYAVGLIGAQDFEYPVALNLRVGTQETNQAGVLRWNEVAGLWEEQPTIVDEESGWMTVAIREPGVYRPGSVEAQNRRPSTKLSNHPNPFPAHGVSDTRIEYELTGPGPVHIEVINALGQRVRLLADEDYQDVGVWVVLWDGRSDDNRRLASGVYYCRLREGGATHLLPMLLIR